MITRRFPIKARSVAAASVFAVLAAPLSPPAPFIAFAQAEELGGQPYKEPQHATPLVPEEKQEQQGAVQKQSSQLPAPGNFNCLNQPKASQNTQTLSSANPLPEKKGPLVGRVVYGKSGEEVGKVQAEVTPQGCDVTAVLVNIGGFIGIGGKQVQIPMSDLRQEGDWLVANTLTAQDIKNMQPVTARK